MNYLSNLAPQLGWANPSISMFFQNVEPIWGRGKRGSGNLVTETRNVRESRAIAVDYPAQVLVKQGNTESVEVEAEDNLLPGLKTEVRNGTLDIFYQAENSKHANPTKTVQITIIVKDLTAVNFASAGELTTENIETDQLDGSLSGAGNLKLREIEVKALRVNLSGAGNMAASGTADDLDMTIRGFGDFNGGELHNEEARVNLSGVGRATVWVDRELNADISGTGSVNYYGSATRHISAVGDAKHLGNK